MQVKQTPQLVIPSTSSRPRPAEDNKEQSPSPITDSGIRQASQDRVTLLESKIEQAESDKERFGLTQEREGLLAGLAANYGH